MSVLPETSFYFKVMVFYGGVLLLLVGNVVAFIYQCRASAKKGEMFFSLKFEESFDDKGRLDLIPINSEAEGTEDYDRIYEAYGFCYGMFFIFTLLTMFSLAPEFEIQLGIAVPAYISFILMLAAGLWLAPIFALFILELNENNVLKIFIYTTLGSFILVFIGSVFAGSDFMVILGLILPLLIIPLVIYHLQSLIYTGMLIGTPWNVSPKNRKRMGLYGMFWFSALLCYQGSTITAIALMDESKNTWAHAVQVAMELFIVTAQLLFALFAAMGSA